MSVKKIQNLIITKTYANLGDNIVGARSPRPLYPLKSRYHKDLSTRCVSPVKKIQNLIITKTYANLGDNIVGARSPRPLYPLKSRYHKDLSTRCVSPVITLLCLILLSTFSGCGDLSDEERIERIRFTEFFLFPTAPYIDKSYIEVVSEGEVTSVEIDFPVEKQAIQKVYSEFVTAYIKKDMGELTKTLDTAAGMEYGTSSVIIHGWNNIKKYIEVNWTGHWGTDCTGDPNSQLTDFHIRPKNVKVPWMEASAKGFMFYYHPDRPVCYQDIGRYYFTKRSGNWKIHQIDGSKFFTDTRYKAP